MQKEIVDIGTRVEMFVDEFLVSRMKRTRLKLHTPQRKEIVLVHEEDYQENWESQRGNQELLQTDYGCTYHSVLRDREKIRLYYRGAAISETDSVTCLAESVLIPASPPNSPMPKH